MPLGPPAQERGVPTSPSQSTFSLQRRKVPESGQPPVALQFSHLPSPSHQPHCGPRCLALRFGVGWGSPLSSHSSLTPGGVLGAPGLSLPHCSAVPCVHESTAQAQPQHLDEAQPLRPACFKCGLRTCSMSAPLRGWLERSPSAGPEGRSQQRCLVTGPQGFVHTTNV